MQDGTTQRLPGSSLPLLSKLYFPFREGKADVNLAHVILISEFVVPELVKFYCSKGNEISRLCYPTGANGYIS